MSERPYDVVLFGASGLTGRMVARYLVERVPEPRVRWALAGRSRSKLEALREELGQPELPILEADSSRPETLTAMAEQTRVVCTAVGPYAKYGAPLVQACVEAGAHYCDLCGEPQFVRRMIDAHHERAEANGVRIVHSCGFDSIPSDLGVYNLQKAAIERFGGPCTEVESVLLGARGGVSGGTAASMAHIMAEARDPAVRRILGDPYSLAPGHRGPDRGEQRGARYSEAAGAWTAPFVMAAINERIVRRSNLLLDFRYGEGFCYGESLRTGPGVSGRARAMATAGGVAGAMAAMAVPPLRSVLERTVMPAPGEGPSDEAIEAGFFKFRLFGTRANGVDGQGLNLVVRGTRDPGYGATACMLAESARVLAQVDDLPMAGVLTPAAAMGEALTARLNATDVTFEVEA